MQRYSNRLFSRLRRARRGRRTAGSGQQPFRPRFERLEDRTLLASDLGWEPPPSIPLADPIFAPGTPAEIVRLYAEREEALSDPAAFTFSDGRRLSWTATNGTLLTQGAPTTITWSIVPDGTSIHGYLDYLNEQTSPSNLRAFLAGIYGTNTADTNLQDEPWFPIVKQAFDSWSQVSGVTFVYEPNDDGAAWTASSLPHGQLGVRGDIRLSGHRIDGNSGVLAYAFYPNYSDIVIDTADSFYNTTSGNSLRLRNVLAHEIGHSLGLEHVCPVNQTKLLEPYATTAFDGPQHDDILAVNRGYGDRLEPNDTPAAASALGTLGSQSVVVNTVSIDDDSDVDYYRFELTTPAFLDLTLTPVGATYLSGAQNSDGSCTAGSNFNSRTQSDLAVKLLAANGTTLLAQANSGAAGASEVLSDVLLTGPGTYFVQVTGNQNAAQLYQLSLAMTPAGEISGTKWHDLDGDGQQDAGEPGLAGWTITLAGAGLPGGAVSTTTDSSGQYRFTGLAPGNYTVSETEQAGWGQTYPTPSAASLQLRLDSVASGLSGALAIQHAGDGSGRLFLAEQGGRIKIVQNGSVLAANFLDIASRIVSGGERGLLGLAFHPNYAEPGAVGEGKFYVYYSAPATAGGDHDSVVAEYRVSATNPNQADPSYERILLRFTQPFSNHNGGDLQFGPDDGYLYISSGDGGSGGDPQGNAQNRANLLGNILRIDVNGNSGPGGQYGIPASNPFVGQAGIRGEIYAYGLRNPFRMSFDDGPDGAASPDRLFVGDVGQNSWEEVDLVTAGGNYGWNYREGAHPFTGTPPVGLELIDPIAEYANPSVGISVIGGYVYRGQQYPELRGKYLFGDFNGRMLALQESGGSWSLTQLNVQGGNPIGQNIRAFGTNEIGELYLVTGGSLLKVQSVTPAASHAVNLADGEVRAGVHFGNQTLPPPVVVTPLPDVTVQEDASDTVINLGAFFDGPDPTQGDRLTYTATVAASVHDVLANVSQASYTHIVRDLLYTRTGHNRGFGPEHDLARENIFEYFVGLGLDTRLDPFSYSGGTYYNVVATKPGATRPTDIYIVGAHYDSVNNPGADDNASGTAAVMEIARVLSQYTFDATLTFIAFDREEQGLIGSTAYASAALARGDQIRAMVNLDMVAYNPSGLNQVRIYDGDNHDEQLKGHLLNAFNVHGYGGPLTALNGGSIGLSDHAPFDVRGYDAALIIESAWGSNPHYHKATDTIDTSNYIDYAFATHIASAAAGYVASAAGLLDAAGLVTAIINGSQLILDWGANANGQASVTVRATDVTGTWVEDAFDVRVNPVNDPPRVVEPLEDIWVPISAPNKTVSLTATFSDFDMRTNGDWLTYSITANTNPGLVSTSLDRGRLTLVFSAGLAGNAEITVRAADSTGLFAEDTFRVVVSDQVPFVRIIDDGDPDYSHVGEWTSHPAGYQGDNRYSKLGTESDAAEWTFTGLASGLYRVSATWPHYVNRATDSPFTMLDGGTALATARINQELAPNDFSDAGANWEDLGGPYAIASGTLKVRLTDAANEYVIADAIRVERIGDIPLVPEIQVLQGSTDIPDNVGSVAFGTTPPGTPLSKTFTVRNVGNGPLTLFEPITVPSGFSVQPSFGSLTLAAGQTTTFELRLDAASVGTYSGQVSFANDDADENPFNFLVQGTVSVVSAMRIIDDGDPGYSHVGKWTSHPAGYQGDNRYSMLGTGSDVAEWTFTGLASGLYRVSATWPSHPNRATDSPFTVFDGGTALATVRINQELAPNDFSDAGANWEDLGGPYAIASGTLKVRLTDAANEYVIADAIRVERIGDIPLVPEIQVLQGSTDIPDNVGSVAFGTTPPGTPLSKTFTVRNVGNGPLTLFEPITVPSGFSVQSSFGSLMLAAGETTTFVLRLDAASVGTYNGQVSFANDDADENPFNFLIQGTVSVVSAMRIIDDGDPGYSHVGKWTSHPAGYQGDNRYSMLGTGSDVAEWTFTGLASGLYRVSATWPHYVNRATDSPFTVFDGGTALATVRINQELAPNDFSDAGANWEDLGGPYAIASGTLKVRLTDAANEYVIADAIRVERIGELISVPTRSILAGGAADYRAAAATRGVEDPLRGSLFPTHDPAGRTHAIARWRPVIAAADSRPAPSFGENELDLVLASLAGWPWGTSLAEESRAKELRQDVVGSYSNVLHGVTSVSLAVDQMHSNGKRYAVTLVDPWKLAY